MIPIDGKFIQRSTRAAHSIGAIKSSTPTFQGGMVHLDAECLQFHFLQFDQFTHVANDQF